MVISDIPLVVVMCVIVLLTTGLSDKGSRLTFLRHDVQQRKKILMLRDTGDERKAAGKIAKGKMVKFQVRTLREVFCRSSAGGLRV